MTLDTGSINKTITLQVHGTFLYIFIRHHYVIWRTLACSRLSDIGKTRKEKVREKLAGREKGKRKGERACNHLFYDPLPPTFSTFEIIRFRLSNC